MQLTNFLAIAILSLGVVVSAESTTSSSGSSSASTTLDVKTTSPGVASSTVTPAVSGTQGLTPLQSLEASCLEACDSNDNTCRAKCILAGQGNNGIADCVTACPKGNGTATENLTYKNCLESCVATASVASAVPTPTPSGSGSSGSGSTGDASTTGGSETTGGSASSKTSASASAKGTGNAGAKMSVEFGGVLAGGVLAAVAGLIL